MCAADENYQVVVVGDDNIVGPVRQLLAGSGLDVQTLGCGQALLDGGDCVGPDLVIIDAVQDEAVGSVRGLSLGRKLKACPQTVSIPVIAVGNSTEHRLQSFEIGVDE